jgi:transcriptional regulator with XRE-family HTH domain
MPMATRERPIDYSRRASAAALLRLGAELRLARRAAGLSLRAVAHECGVSASLVERVEHGSVAGPALESVMCIGATVGLEVAIRAYPRSDPLRDAGQARLLGRLHGELHPRLGWQQEVPFPSRGDPRAWDALIRGERWQLPVEAETAITDGQALERKLALKIRDGGFDHLILLVADTRRNRAAIPALRVPFPLRTRQVLAALREGRDPGASGIVML